MADSFADTNFLASAFAPVDIGEILAWLDAPPAADARDDLSALHRFLTDLRRCQATRAERISALARFYPRSIVAVAPLLASLSDVRLPIHRRTRHLIRSVQTLLRTLAEDLQTCFETEDEAALRAQGLPREQILWRIIDLHAQHLLIGNLAAAPAGVGIWKQLHQSFTLARQLNAADYVPPDAQDSVRRVYYAAVLLGCAQPASFTSPEVGFVAAYLERFVDHVEAADQDANGAIFWLDPERDAPAVARSRKTVPPETAVRCFSCDRLGKLLEQQIGALEAGLAPQDLPAFAATPAGRGVLRRLLAFWGAPGKRQFPRRRQNYRASLCAGLGSLWRLFSEGEATFVDTSTWMITNESPDGYALMHVAGKTGDLAVGNITAIRSESGSTWQICIVRWALSENQEHLELGLQLLATRAVPALLALVNGEDAANPLAVLVLPEVPTLRESERLVVPTGALGKPAKSLVLIVEKDNLRIREIRSTGLGERNSQIEVFAIETDSLSV